VKPKLAAFFLALIVCLGVGSAKAQETTPVDVIKIDSNLVSVPVIVSDRNGRYISGLAAERFTLYDNSTRQKIAFFENTEEPLNIALLLDTSRSTQGVIDDIRKAAKNFLKELRPQDRAMIVSFDYAMHRLCPLTSDRKTLENAIKHAEVGQYLGTMLNDAVKEVAEVDFKPINGRKAIILLSDGQDHGSMLSNSELLASESESDTMVYSIFYASSGPGFRGFRDRPFPRGRGGFPGGRGRGGGPMGWQFPRQRPGGQRGQRKDQMDEAGAEFMSELAEVTAGRFYRSKKTDLKKTFALIADELRFQYRLAFKPDDLQKDGSVHLLQVKVDAADVAVRARKQYRAANNTR
jgi:Ca-activated chloride channel homolog